MMYMKSNRFSMLLLTAALGISLSACKDQSGQVRETKSFNSHWRFSLTADSTAINPDYSDTDWRELNLPHDWSIEGVFDEKNPAGVGGGALPGGTGWYRKTFSIPDQYSEKKYLSSLMVSIAIAMFGLTDFILDIGLTDIFHFNMN